MRLTGRSIALAALSALPLASAITPDQMLAAPRRGEAVPNANGDWAVFTSTNYSWTTHKSQTVWNLLNVTSGETSLLYNGSTIAEMVWVGNGTNVIYVNGTNEEEDGGVSLYSADVTDLSSAQFIASLPATYSGMKAVTTSSGDIHFLMNAMSYSNGTAYNEFYVETPLSTARIYTSIYVRHWDRWLDNQTYAVFGGVLTSSNGSYSFDGQMTNYVTGIKNISTAESPVQPFGGSGDYDISPNGRDVIFLTKNPDLALSNYTNSIIYHVPFNGTSDQAVAINSWENAPALARGAAAAPTFSTDGEYIAYLQMDGIDYESDRSKIYIANNNPREWNITLLAENWDRGPDNLKWSANSSNLVLAASDRGRARLFVVPVTATNADYVPANVTDEGSVAGYSILPDDTILVSDSKIWSSRDIYTASQSNGWQPNYLLQANLVDPNLAGLGPEDVSEFYFQGNFTQVQSWIVYPEGFSPNNTYPLAFLVHGGPQVPWNNAWSTRWNMKVWADQGYVVIAPNPTASPGWGQAFVDAIQNNWGSYPYDDLVKCWQYVDANLSYVDTANGIAAGASYGGYMMNWIQGHDLGRQFKALVTHDGSTNTNAQYTSEELWFMQHDFNGTIWANRDNYERWNPINHIENWATPHFVVHNSKDYRLPVAEGVFLFNVLQERGVPSKFLNFPDENHWVLNRENSLVWHSEIYKWINYYSGVDNSTGPY